MTVSMIGDGIYLVSIAWQVLSIENRPGALALVGIAWSLPQVLLVIASGALSDRLERRHLMIAGDAIRFGRDRRARDPVDHRPAHDPDHPGIGHRVRSGTGSLPTGLLVDHTRDRAGRPARAGQFARAARSALRDDAGRPTRRRRPHHAGERRVRLPRGRFDVRVLRSDDPRHADPADAEGTAGGANLVLRRCRGGVPIRAAATMAADRHGRGHGEPARGVGSVGDARACGGEERPWGRGVRARISSSVPEGSERSSRLRCSASGGRFHASP